jgi:hypothetical protein
MTRLIDADALLEAIKNKYGANGGGIIDLITKAPTVEREGWVSVPIEPTEEMLKEAQSEQGDHGSYIEWVAYGYADDVIATYKAMLSAAPKE